MIPLVSIEQKVLYRYEYDLNYPFRRYCECKLILRTYSIIDTTPCGYWIDLGWGDKKWVQKEGKKRFAYPTKEEAMTNLIKRTEFRQKIHKARLAECEAILEAVEKIKN